RGAPAVEDLVGGRGAPQVARHDRGAGAVLADHECGRGVTPGRLVGPPGQAVALVGHDDQGRGRGGERAQECPDTRSQGAAEVKCGDLPRESQRGVQSGRIGLVEVSGRGGGEPQGADGQRRGTAQGGPGRFDPHGGGVLVVRGDGPGSLASPRSEEFGDLGALQPGPRHIAPGAHDPSDLLSGPRRTRHGGDGSRYDLTTSQESGRSGTRSPPRKAVTCKGSGMDFGFSPEQLSFVAEVERFLDEHDDPDVFDVTRENMAQIVDTPARRAFMALLGEQGWLGITWPKEYGGKEGDGVYEHLLNESLARRGGPQ